MTLNHIVEKLDIYSECQAMGFQLTGTVSQSGWAELADPYRPDENPSAGIHTASGVLHRFFPDGRKENINFFDLARDFHPEVLGDDIRNIVNHFAEKTGVKVHDKKKTDEISEDTVRYFQNSITDEIRKHLHSKRGLNDATIQKHKIGYSKNRNRISIPIYNEQGELVNIRFHRVSGDQTPKTLNICGHGKAALFGVNHLKALPTGSTVLICEGEPDRMILEQETGLLAVTQTNGAAAFQKQWVKHFHGKHVVLVWDCDEPGRQAVENIVLPAFKTDLQDGKILSMKVVWLFDDPGNKDLKDSTDFFVKAGGTGSALLDTIEQTEPVNPNEIRQPDPAQAQMKTPDGAINPAYFFSGSGFKPALFIDCFLEGQNIIHDGNCFYRYNSENGVWERIHDNLLGQKFTAMLGDKAKKSYILDALKLLEFKTFKTADEIKPDSNLINLKNGMLDLTEKTIKNHDKKYYSKAQIPIEYDPQATAPRFMKYLNEIFPDDPVKIQTLQDFAGYCLYPGIFIHKCLFLLGGGNNGKSVFLSTLCKVVGLNNVSAIELDQLDDKFLLGTLRGKLLNCCAEIEVKKRMNSSTFKKAITGDLIQADEKGKPPFTFRPIAKHVFSMNEIPVITDRSFGFTRRLIIVTFNQRIHGSAVDPFLESKLESELSGILNWCLEGLDRILKTKQITISEQTLRDQENILLTLDPVKLFVEECCALGESFMVKKSTLYDTYKRFCESSNLRALGKGKFYSQLCSDQSQIDEFRPDGGARHFLGITLIDE